MKGSRGTTNSLPYLERSGDFYFTSSHTSNMRSLRTRTVMGQMSWNMTNYPEESRNSCLAQIRGRVFNCACSKSHHLDKSWLPQCYDLILSARIALLFLALLGTGLNTSALVLFLNYFKALMSLGK